jgi:SAM-dependent methyltransferase
MFAFALTIFLGAFLLFQVQPLIGKYILPWFGGGTGVWTACLLFFQTGLLGGYAYAHLLSRWFKPRSQVSLHGLLLVGALASLPIIPADAWKPRGEGDPTLHIFGMLTVCLGLPYVVLSSTGPLVQHWFSRTHPGVSPYRLYALSNVGSLLALVSFPFFFETHFSRVLQARLWGWGLAAYAVACGVCAWKVWRSNPGQGVSVRATGSAALESRPSAFDRLLWLLWPACASALLVATTNKLCQDVAVVPFLWVLPLALYLLTFIITFDNPRWYRRGPAALALPAALAGLCWVLFQGTDASLRTQIGVYAAGLFVCGLVCHGELYRRRPGPSRLTGYYLMIAAGGALGGLFVAVGAPLLFTDYYELHWAMLFCGLLFLVVCWRGNDADGPREWRGPACALTLAVFIGLDRALAYLTGRHPAIPGGAFLGLRAGMWTLLALLAGSWMVRGKFRAFRHWRWLACAWLLPGLVALAAALWVQARKAEHNVVCRTRNFFGTLKVCEYRQSDPAERYFLLQHGRITHGLQFTDPARARWATTYYGRGSGVELALRALPAAGRRIGLVGLGTGTLTAFGRAGDDIRIYEINRDVQRLAASWFTYLSNCPARVEVVLGDARLSLEREPPQQFDLLALDAFSGDAIPVHLLTKEAFALYGRHLKPDGVIAVHISNRHLDLAPVVANLARAFRYKLTSISHEEDEGDDADDEAGREWWVYSSTWALLTRNEAISNFHAIRQAADAAPTNAVAIPLWTDDFASVFQVVK